MSLLLCHAVCPYYSRILYGDFVLFIQHNVSKRIVLFIQRILFYYYSMTTGCQGLCAVTLSVLYLSYDYLFIED